MNGNFIEAPIWEALNVIENLVGNLLVVSIKEDITLARIMKKLDKIELEMPSITKINELDHKIQGNLNRLDSSMHKIVKTLETIKFLDLESSRIDKIEEVLFPQSKLKRKKLRQKRNLSSFMFPRFLELNIIHPLPKKLKL